jgi:hypothetical protein
MSILRSMDDTFNYVEFRRQLKEQNFSATQRAMLDLRLNLLDSCLQGGNASNRLSGHFRQGQLTIIEYENDGIATTIMLIQTRQPVFALHGWLFSLWVLRHHSRAFHRNKDERIWEARR